LTCVVPPVALAINRKEASSGCVLGWIYRLETALERNLRCGAAQVNYLKSVQAAKRRSRKLLEVWDAFSTVGQEMA
jgi:hypothetical protein